MVLYFTTVNWDDIGGVAARHLYHGRNPILRTWSGKLVAKLPCALAPTSNLAERRKGGRRCGHVAEEKRERPVVALTLTSLTPNCRPASSGRTVAQNFDEWSVVYQEQAVLAVPTAGRDTDPARLLPLRYLASHTHFTSKNR